MQRFKKILFVMEHGDASLPALERAVALAESNQAELMVVAVVPWLSAGMRGPGGVSVAQDCQAIMVREEEARIAAVVEPYLERLDIQHKVFVGTSFLEIIRAVLRNDHDLVIKCPESPSWLGRFFSGDDMHLLRKCPCPVWFVKPRVSNTYQRILAAVDLDDDYMTRELDTRHRMNVQILEMASSLAIAESAELHLVYAWESAVESISGFMVSSDTSSDRLAADLDQERRQHQQLLDELLRRVGVQSESVGNALDYLDIRTHLRKGTPRKEIPALAKRLGVDCIVMGTVARTGIRGLLMGNTAEVILGQIDCAVLAIKPSGFVTPVTPAA